MELIIIFWIAILLYYLVDTRLGNFGVFKRFNKMATKYDTDYIYRAIRENGVKPNYPPSGDVIPPLKITIDYLSSTGLFNFYLSRDKNKEEIFNGYLVVRLSNILIKLYAFSIAVLMLIFLIDELISQEYHIFGYIILLLFIAGIGYITAKGFRDWINNSVTGYKKCISLKNKLINDEHLKNTVRLLERYNKIKEDEKKSFTTEDWDRIEKEVFGESTTWIDQNNSKKDQEPSKKYYKMKDYTDALRKVLGDSFELEKQQSDNKAETQEWEIKFIKHPGKDKKKPNSESD